MEVITKLQSYLQSKYVEHGPHLLILPFNAQLQFILSATKTPETFGGDLNIEINLDSSENGFKYLVRLVGINSIDTGGSVGTRALLNPERSNSKILTNPDFPRLTAELFSNALLQYEGPYPQLHLVPALVPAPEPVATKEEMVELITSLQEQVNQQAAEIVNLR